MLELFLGEQQPGTATSWSHSEVGRLRAIAPARKPILQKRDAA